MASEFEEGEELPSTQELLEKEMPGTKHLLEDALNASPVPAKKQNLKMELRQQLPTCPRTSWQGKSCQIRP